MRLRAVLFDAVGTLIRTREPVGETYARVAAAHGVRLPAARLDDGFRRIHAGAPPMVFPDAPAEAIPDLERDWWRSRVRETFRATDQMARFGDFDAFFHALFMHYGTGDAWQAMPGAAPALSSLRARGLALAVASNLDHRLPSILQALDLLPFFDLVWGPGAARARKPEPAFFVGLLARLALPAAEAIHVGDDPETDVAAAERVGLRALAIVPPATLADLPGRIRALEGDS